MVVTGTRTTQDGSLNAARRYATIVADPPWEKPDTGARTHSSQGNWDTGARPMAGIPSITPYPQMTLAEIEALPVGDLAADDAHLYVWTFGPYIPETYRLVRAWGFSASALLTGCKEPMGLGFGGAYVPTTEHVLFARRGRDVRLRRWDTTWFRFKRGAHSQKPESFLDMVEAVSPEPRLESRSSTTKTGSPGSTRGSHGRPTAAATTTARADASSSSFWTLPEWRRERSRLSEVLPARRRLRRPWKLPRPRRRLLRSLLPHSSVARGNAVLLPVCDRDARAVRWPDRAGAACARPDRSRGVTPEEILSRVSAAAAACADAERDTRDDQGVSGESWVVSHAADLTEALERDLRSDLLATQRTPVDAPEPVRYRIADDRRDYLCFRTTPSLDGRTLLSLIPDSYGEKQHPFDVVSIHLDDERLHAAPSPEPVAGGPARKDGGSSDAC